MKSSQSNDDDKFSERRSAAAAAPTSSSLFSKQFRSQYWFPSHWEDLPQQVHISSNPAFAFSEDSYSVRNRVGDSIRWIHQQQQHQQRQQQRQRRSWKRRVFLLLTEPDTSVASAMFFLILVVVIAACNVVMILQTMDRYQFIPTDCRSCGGPVHYVFDDDSPPTAPDNVMDVPCLCSPTPVPWTISFLDWSVYFFTAEWSVRVLTFEPPPSRRAATMTGRFCQQINFVFSMTTVLDALAIFPYYIEMFKKSNGLMSLRLLRFLRVFQLIRLGQYNDMFMSLTTVLFQSFQYLKLLLGVLLFGAALFGSMLFWLEKGTWKYFDKTGTYEYVRTDQHGAEEISPFTSIPDAFWWFLVTATTVGYGDVVPTSTAGKWVAVAAMLTGVLVIAFPVSVFSDLWSKELRKMEAFCAESDDEEEDIHDEELGIGGKNRRVSTIKEEETESSSSASQWHDLHGATPGVMGTVTGETQPLVGQWSSSTSPTNREYTSSSSSSSNRLLSAWIQTDTEHGRYDAAPDHCVLQKDDVAQIFAHLHTLHETEKQIRNVFKKYHVLPPQQQSSSQHSHYHTTSSSYHHYHG